MERINVPLHPHLASAYFAVLQRIQFRFYSKPLFCFQLRKDSVREFRDLCNTHFISHIFHAYAWEGLLSNRLLDLIESFTVASTTGPGIKQGFIIVIIS